MTRPVTLLTTALLLAGCAGSAPPVGQLPTGVLHFETGSGEVLVEVSIAETTESRQQGLMGVEEMDEEAGMVFLHPEPVQQAFWMKDTLIPLTVAFWDQRGRVLTTLDMEPCREASCPVYDPGVAWIGAVEVNQGFLADQGVAIGDPVRLER